MSKPRNYQTEAIIIKNDLSKGRLKERIAPSEIILPPSKERGTQGVRFNLNKIKSD